MENPKAAEPLQRKFLKTFVIGALIEVALLALHGSSPLRSVEDIGADLFMRLYSGTLLKTHDSVPFVYFDVDEETYVKWEEPIVIPRDKLATLLRLAVEGEARAVIVDVDLSWSGTGEAALAAVLADYGRQSRRTSIVLTRSLRFPETDPTSHYPRPRHTFLDPLVANMPGVFWAAFHVDVMPDMIVRRWHLWEAVCTNGTVSPLPSVQLLTLALITAPAAGPQTLQDVLALLVPRDCTVPLQTSTKPTLNIGGRTLRVFPKELEQRILFTIPWKLPRGYDYPRVFLEHVAVPLLTTISAHQLTETMHLARPEMVRERIVIIGGSYREARDYHQTPVGPMPGALILINAIHTALQYGALQPPLHGIKGLSGLEASRSWRSVLRSCPPMDGRRG